AVVGLGGTGVGGFLHERTKSLGPPDSEEIKTQKDIWPNPYPWASDAQYANALGELLEKSLSLSSAGEGVDGQIILLTHTGPHSSATSALNINATHVVYGGSPGQTSAILKHFGARDVNNTHEVLPRLLCNLHGHVHHGVGIDSAALPNQIKVINPGSLDLGSYAELVFSKKTVIGKRTSRNADKNKYYKQQWFLTETTLKKLVDDV
ncbi:unnamed protein product, partial [Amoebophrya sp. A25]